MLYSKAGTARAARQSGVTEKMKASYKTFHLPPPKTHSPDLPPLFLPLQGKAEIKIAQGIDLY